MGIGSPYLIRPPKVYRWIFPEAVFRGDPNKQEVFLTFDDGPHPEATPFVLDVLKANGIKATFFILGKNAELYPELVRRVTEEGHSIGNHGMNHLNGWLTEAGRYADDVAKGREITGAEIFRPPYGRMTPAQYRLLKETERIVFWDVISGDFDRNIDGNTVMNNVLKNARNGSIIVMHDSKKAMKNLQGSLNGIIGKMKEDGFSFRTLSLPLEPQY